MTFDKRNSLAVLIHEKTFKSLQDVSVSLVSNTLPQMRQDLLSRYFVIWRKQNGNIIKSHLIRGLNSHFIQSKRPVTKINI